MSRKETKQQALWKSSQYGHAWTDRGVSESIAESGVILSGPYIWHIQPRLKPAEIRVYDVLRSHYPNIYPSIKRIAHIARISDTAVKTAIKQLTEIGLIQVDKKPGTNGQWDSNVYTPHDIHDPAKFDKIMEKLNRHRPDTGASTLATVEGPAGASTLSPPGQVGFCDRGKHASEPGASTLATKNTKGRASKEGLPREEHQESGGEILPSPEQPIGLWPSAIGATLALSFERLGVEPTDLNELPDEPAAAYTAAVENYIGQQSDESTHAALLKAQRMQTLGQMNQEAADDLNRQNLGDEYQVWLERQTDNTPAIDHERFCRADPRWLFVSPALPQGDVRARYNDLLNRLAFLSERLPEAGREPAGATQAQAVA